MANYPPTSPPQWPQTASEGTVSYQSHGAGALHTYSHEELRAFTEFINEFLAGDVDLQSDLPVNPNSDGLFGVVAKGLLLACVAGPCPPSTSFPVNSAVALVCAWARSGVSLGATSSSYPLPLQCPLPLSVLTQDRKMVNKIKPGVIDERKLTRSRTPNTFQINQNLTLGIQGCKELGLVVVNVGAEDLRAGKER